MEKFRYPEIKIHLTPAKPAEEACFQKKQAKKKLNSHHRPAARAAVKIVVGANPSGNAGPPTAAPRTPWRRVRPTAPAIETSPEKCFGPRECQSNRLTQLQISPSLFPSE
jgi:hypothetical protein